MEDLEYFFDLEILDNTKKKQHCEVSIWCLTYNHSKYIRKALDSFLAQETSFGYEIIVFDDASKDNNQEIIREYVKKYPDKIKAFLGRRNTYRDPLRYYMVRELMNMGSTGKYIAWCEGDDYWIYNNKLQRQYDLLEQNSDISMCYHNAIRFDGKRIMPEIIDFNSQVVDDNEIFYCEKGRAPTASYFYRKELYENLPSYMLTSGVDDDPLRMWMNFKGSVYYLDKCWSVRNYKHEGSFNYIWDNDKDFILMIGERNYSFFESFDKATDGKYKEYIKKFKTYICIKELDLSVKNNKVEELHNAILNGIKKLGEGSKDIFQEQYLARICDCDDYTDYLIKKAFDRKVYLYGAGKEAKRIIDIFTNKEIEIKKIVVTDMINNPRKLSGIDVIALNDAQINEDILVVLGLNSTNRLQVINKLIEKGIHYKNII